MARKPAYALLAGSYVLCAKQRGDLVRLKGSGIACVDCGKPASHYDHRDYSRPLEVEPVCQSCNTRRGPAKFSDAVPKAVMKLNVNVIYREALEKIAALEVSSHRWGDDGAILMEEAVSIATEALRLAKGET